MLGVEIGSYRVVSKIGEGGMGSVYLAEHQLLRRKVAVKVLLKDLSGDPSLVQRFINEARATSQIVHPGIVRVLDFGQLPDGSTYMLMEHLEGETLRERMQKQRRMPLDQALALLRQMADALGAAHARRVVHRDLKPENIFIVADETAPFGVQPKILDFGIAKILDPTMDAPQTRAGSIIGTPLYMSPEQCRAEPKIDHRADLYALGGIFYYMLCGRPPFERESAAALFSAHLHDAPPVPSARVPGTPAWVDALTARLLAKSRDERFQTTDEVRDAIAAGRASSPASRRLAPDEATVLGPQDVAAQLAALQLQPPPQATPRPPSGMTPSPPPLVTPRPPSGMTPSPPPLVTPAPRVLTPTPHAGTPSPEVAATTVDASTPPPGSSTMGGGGDLAATRAHSAGELAIPQRRKSGISIPLLLTATFAVTIVVGLGGFYLLGRARAPEPPDETRPRTVHVVIDSDPSGADVYADGKSVCVTPCSLDRPPHAGQQTWVVAKPGYDEQPLTLAADRDGHGKVMLRAQMNP